MTRYTLARLAADTGRRRVFLVIVVARRDALAPWRAVVRICPVARCAPFCRSTLAVIWLRSDFYAGAAWAQDLGLSARGVVGAKPKRGPHLPQPGRDTYAGAVVRAE